MPSVTGPSSKLGAGFKHKGFVKGAKAKAGKLVFVCGAKLLRLVAATMALTTNGKIKRLYVVEIFIFIDP